MIGFGARAMRSDQGAKYINSAEGELYRKSETLYGVDRARGAITKAGRAVVVKGYTDVLALHQAGIEEAVGVMGTAITEEQVAMLSRQVKEVVLALDADSAGQEAMLRAQRKAEGRQMRLRVAAMPEGKEPGAGGRPRRGERSASEGWWKRPWSCRSFRSGWCWRVPMGARRSSVIGRWPRSRRCWPRWGRASAATSWCERSPSDSTSIRRW